MQSMSFLVVMRSLMKRPGMYVGDCETEESFRYAVPMIIGMSCFDDTGIMESFRDWLISEKSCEISAFGWPDMIEKYFKQQQVSPNNYVHAFIDVFSEFLESQGIDTEEPKQPKQKMHLKIAQGGEPDVAYLYLPDYPRQNTAGSVARQVRARDHIENYNGPDLYLDFDKDDVLIGVEILV